MAVPQRDSENLRLGSVTFRPGVASLASKTRTVRLTPQQLRLLSALVAAEEQTLSKDRLIETVWEGRYVGGDAVARAVHELRKQFAKLTDDTAIETLHGFGYRLVVQATPIQSSPAVDRSAPDQASRTLRRAVWLAAGVALAGLTGSFWWWLVGSQATRPGPLEPWTPTIEVKSLELHPAHEYLAAIPAGRRIFVAKTSLETWIGTETDEGAQRVWGTEGSISHPRSSPDGTRVAFVVRGEDCSIVSLRIATGEAQILGNCENSSSGDAVGWIGPNRIGVAQSEGRDQILLREFNRGTEAPARRLAAEGCRIPVALTVDPEERTWLACHRLKGDGLYTVQDGRLELVHAYRSIRQLASDAEGQIYSIHEAGWKSGVTRFSPGTKRFAFAETGWVTDIAYDNGELVLARDLSGTDLVGFDVESTEPLVVEQGPVRSLAVAVDDRGGLWQVDDRGGSVGIYRNDQRVSGFEWLTELSLVVRLAVSVEQEWLWVTLREEPNSYVHLWVGLSLDPALRRRLPATTGHFQIQGQRIAFDGLGGRSTLDLTSGEVHLESDPLEPDLHSAICPGSPLVAGDAEITIQPTPSGVRFSWNGSEVAPQSWEDPRITRPCGLSQPVWDSRRNRVLYVATTGQYRDLAIVKVP